MGKGVIVRMINRWNSKSSIYERNYRQQRAISSNRKLYKLTAGTLYPDLNSPMLYFITNTLREVGLITRNRERGESRYQYINYPKHTLGKLDILIERSYYSLVVS